MHDRYAEEMKAKTGDQLRNESIYTERINTFEKEVSRLEMNMIQSKSIEGDLR